jgi:hypothetical protein
VLVEAWSPLPAYDLKKQDAKAVDVGLGREEALGSILRSDVSTDEKCPKKFSHHKLETDYVSMRA